MLETLKPPTDSLYKFLSIIGLVIFLASVITPMTLMRQLKTDYAEFIRVITAHNLDAKTWEETGKQLDQHSSQLIDKQEKYIKFAELNAPLSQQKTLLEEVKAAETNYQENRALFLKQLTEWRKQKVEVDYKKDLLENTKEEVRDIFTVCTIAAPVGLIMSITGFVLWYKRTQRWEDLVLRQRVEEPKSKIIIPD